MNSSGSRPFADKKSLSHMKSKLLAEQVEEQLFQYIQDRSLKPGDRLPNEFELAEYFHAGRSTIREAVKLLASRGVLSVRRGSGTYVTGTAPADLDPLGLLRLDAGRLELALDLADIRMLLEPGMAELAARSAGPEDIKRLREACALVEQRIQEGESYIKEDIAFHICLAECSKNRVAGQLIPLIDTAVLMFVNVTHTRLTQETILTHRAIVEAVEAGDFIGARSAMMMHMTYNRSLIQRLMREAEAGEE